VSVIEKRARGSSPHEWPGGDELVENSPTATLTAAQWLSHGSIFGEAAERSSLAEDRSRS
jgi:hypothetical protein